MINLKEKSISGVKWTTASSIILVTVQIIRLSILTRYLEKSDFGLIALVTLVLGFVKLFNDLGISVAILHRQNITRNEYNSLFWLNIMLTGALYVILCGLTPLAATFYQEPILNKLIPLMGLGMLIGLIGKQNRLILQKDLEFKIISIIDIIGMIISMVLAIVLAYFGYGVYSIIYSSLLEATITSCYFFISYNKKNPIKFHFNYKESQPFLRIGLNQSGAQLLDYFSNQIDIFLIGKFYSTSDLGIYNLAKQLALRPYQIINPIITRVAIPAFAKIQHDKASMQRNYMKITSLLSIVNFPIYLFLCAAAGPIIHLFYGKSYLEVIPIFQILCIWGILASINNPAGILVSAMGRTDLSLKWTVFRVLTNPLFIIVASFGSIQYVAISQAVFGLLAYWLYWRYMIYNLIQLSFKAYLNNITKELISGIIGGLTIYFILNGIDINFSNPLITIVISGLTYFLIYSGCLILINKKAILLLNDTLQISENLSRFPAIQIRFKKILGIE